MSAAKKFDRLPEEVLLDQYIKEGRATRQRLSMRALRNPDASLQCRVQHLDVDHSRRLGNIIADDREADLNPIIVFELPDGKRVIADGFHRHDAYSQLKRPDIPAWVIKGEWREAMEYATCCNQGLSLGRKREDIDKAIRMILEDDVWFRMSNLEIGRHCGCSSPTVGRVRMKHCHEKNIDIPEVFTRKDGTKARNRPKRVGRRAENFAICEQRRKDKTVYVANINGKAVYLGVNREDAQKKADALVENEVSRAQVLDIDALPKAFTRRQIFCEHPKLRLPGVRTQTLVLSGGKAVVSWTNFHSPDELPSALGRIILAKQFLGIPDARQVVLCYREDGNPAAIALAEAAGFEFLTPDELVASLKGETSEP